jgi:DNA-binding NarL/FixJ family response regulator
MTAALVYDEHLLFAEAFAQVLRQAGARAVGTASVLRALDIVLRGPVTDVVLGVDPGSLPGSDLVTRVRRERPEVRIVCIAPPHPALGAAAPPDVEVDLVLSRGLTLPELVRAVLGSTAGNGTAVVVGDRRAAPRTQQSRELSAQQFAAQFLTRREREVLGLLVAGESTRGIAAALGITPATARGYLQSAFTKLGVHSRFEAVALVLQHDLAPGAADDSEPVPPAIPVRWHVRGWPSG